MSDDKSPIWVVIPAAGEGKRFGGETPKQYLPLSGRPVLEHTIARFAGLPRLAGLVIALAPGDALFDGIARPDGMPVHTVTGGGERMESVHSALAWLLAGGEARATDWVMVHDAVRPLVPREDLDNLVAACDAGHDGALLGVPVADTLKRAAEGGAVEETVGRDGLWRALTPQMFRLGALHDALAAARSAGRPVTDEAMAMEQAGVFPRLVAGDACNIKITRTQDLLLANAWLAAEA